MLFVPDGQIILFYFRAKFLAYTNSLPSRKPMNVPGDSSRLSSGAENFWNAQNVDQISERSAQKQQHRTNSHFSRSVVLKFALFRISNIALIKF
jgi:hypothetical protein